MPWAKEGKECKAVERRSRKELPDHYKTIEPENKKADRRQDSQKQEELIEVPVHVPQALLQSICRGYPTPKIAEI